jgi:hypothetical protein
VRGDIFEIKRALSFLGAPLPKREEAAEPPIRSAVARIGKQARSILQIEARADHELDADLLGGEMGADHAGKGVAIGDGDGLEADGFRRRDQLFGVRAAAQEGEVGGDVELGVAGHGADAPTPPLSCPRRRASSNP